MTDPQSQGIQKIQISHSLNLLSLNNLYLQLIRKIKKICSPEDQKLIFMIAPKYFLDPNQQQFIQLNELQHKYFYHGYTPSSPRTTKIAKEFDLHLPSLEIPIEKYFTMQNIDIYEVIKQILFLIEIYFQSDILLTEEIFETLFKIQQKKYINILEYQAKKAWDRYDSEERIKPVIKQILENVEYQGISNQARKKFKQLNERYRKIQQQNMFVEHYQQNLNYKLDKNQNNKTILDETKAQKIQKQLQKWKEQCKKKKFDYREHQNQVDQMENRIAQATERRLSLSIQYKDSIKKHQNQVNKVFQKKDFKDIDFPQTSRNIRNIRNSTKSNHYDLQKEQNFLRKSINIIQQEEHQFQKFCRSLDQSTIFKDLYNQKISKEKKQQNQEKQTRFQENFNQAQRINRQKVQSYHNHILDLDQRYEQIQKLKLPVILSPCKSREKRQVLFSPRTVSYKTDYSISQVDSHAQQKIKQINELYINRLQSMDKRIGNYEQKPKKKINIKTKIKTTAQEQ